MKMTQSQANKFLVYYSHCQFLYDFIESDWERSSGNVRKVKLLTNQLKSELEKNINHIFGAKEAEGVDMGNVLDQFVNASAVMGKLFQVGLIMDTMTEESRLELNDKMNKLFEDYNINLNA